MTIGLGRRCTFTPRSVGLLIVLINIDVEEREVLSILWLDLAGFRENGIGPTHEEVLMNVHSKCLF